MGSNHSKHAVYSLENENSTSRSRQQKRGQSVIATDSTPIPKRAQVRPTWTNIGKDAQPVSTTCVSRVQKVRGGNESEVAKSSKLPTLPRKLPPPPNKVAPRQLPRRPDVVVSEPKKHGLKSPEKAVSSKDLQDPVPNKPKKVPTTASITSKPKNKVQQLPDVVTPEPRPLPTLPDIVATQPRKLPARPFPDVTATQPRKKVPKLPEPEAITAKTTKLLIKRASRPRKLVPTTTKAEQEKLPEMAQTVVTAKPEELDIYPVTTKSMDEVSVKPRKLPPKPVTHGRNTSSGRRIRKSRKISNFDPTVQVHANPLEREHCVLCSKLKYGVQAYKTNALNLAKTFAATSSNKRRRQVVVPFSTTHGLMGF